VFAPVLTFAIFSVIARQQGGSTTLDTARVFTSLSLFSLLSEPITSLVMALATFIGSVGCFARIQEFLTRDERVDERVHAVDFIEETMSKSPSLSIAEADKRSVSTMEGGGSSFRSSSVFTPRDAISICDGSFGWIAGKESLLKQICTSIPRQKMTMVIGPVGCGKSTFLKALLGEVPALSGQVSISSSSVAFCDQTPWHSNGTIRQSIVASSPVDQRWYSTVVRACALDVDFDYLPLGDETVIGSQGIALSGGQSQRIVSFSRSTVIPYCY
jgi:ATP-binding cassette, subfamily C (CFTR/MRP), member 1